MIMKGNNRCKYYEKDFPDDKANGRHSFIGNWIMCWRLFFKGLLECAKWNRKLIQI